MKLLTLLWLVSFSSSIAALLGARAAWKLRTTEDDHPRVGVVWAIMLLCYGVGEIGETFESIISGPRNQDISFLVWVFGWKALQGVGIWAIALTLMNGDQGFIRRVLSRWIEKIRAKVLRK